MSLRDELVVLLDVSFKALSESGSIPLLILLVNEQSAPFTLLFRIRCLNFHKCFSIFICLFVADGNLSCMVLLSLTSSVMFPSSAISVFFLIVLGSLWPLTFYLVFVGVVQA